MSSDCRNRRPGALGAGRTIVACLSQRAGWPVGSTALAGLLFLTACAAAPRGDGDATAWSVSVPVRGGSEKREGRETSLEIGGQAVVLGLGRFWLGDLDEPWDSGSRFEVSVRRRMGRQGTLEPFFGGYAYYEEHEWQEAGASVDYEALGLGAELGVVVDPFPQPPDAGWRITMTPYSRVGVGFPDGRFDRVPHGAGTTGGDFDGIRAEGSIGADVRLEIAGHLSLGVGLGVGGWISTSVEGVTRDAHGSIVDPKDRLRSNSWDFFARAGLQLRF
ncbi:MAG: hypothetical protein JXQ29_09760 [Planctomycetes bacterium]|nr:hypothetical protein [Planctomycetota bacterium]